MTIENESRHVCPWWLGYLIDNPFRRLMHPADRILGPYVREGMRVLDVGCGFGHYTLGMARLVGPSGRVVAADLQEKMLDKTRSRASAKGLDERIETAKVGARALGVAGPFDFVIAANVVHEVPDPAGLFAELLSILNPGGLLFVHEPNGHVPADRFDEEIAMAARAGFLEAGRPPVARQRTVLLRKADTEA